MHYLVLEMEFLMTTIFILRFFLESGKRYTPAYFTGYDSQGRPIYIASTTDLYTNVGQNWFWIDLNFEKYIFV